ncbi:MAG: hypothetical protein WAM83_08445, partial [Bradyrhizobium sp.]
MTMRARFLIRCHRQFPNAWYPQNQIWIRGIKISERNVVKSGMKLFELDDQAIMECFIGRARKKSFLIAKFDIAGSTICTARHTAFKFRDSGVADRARRSVAL